MIYKKLKSFEIINPKQKSKEFINLDDEGLVHVLINGANADIYKFQVNYILEIQKIYKNTPEIYHATIDNVINCVDKYNRKNHDVNDRYN